MTPDNPNAYPKVGSIVISEIMYNTDAIVDAEYIELYNIESFLVPLYNPTENLPWKFTDGIDCNLPMYTVMPAHSYLLLVKDVNVFESQYPGVPGGVPVIEWDSGKLDNGGERVQLSMPGDEKNGTRYYIRIDRVNYDDQAPWPTSGDGDGNSLERLFPEYYGNDPNNWQAASPSPGE